MEETDAEERNIISDANNVTMDTFCLSPVTKNTQGENANAILKNREAKQFGCAGRNAKRIDD